MSLLLMWKQQLLMNNFKYFSLTGSGRLLLPGSIKGKFKELTLSGNSVQGENPAPDNPQEIKSAGRKSRNLLIENMSVFTVQDNIAYIPLPEGHETKLYTMLIQKKPGENDDVGFTCGFYDKSNMTATYSAPCLQAGNLVTGNGIVNSKIGVNHFVCFSPADSRFFDIYNVMYAEGKETTLDYEPYGYFFDVKVTGKNLIKTSPILPKRWSNNIDNHVIEYITLKPHTTYTLAMEEDTKYVNDLRVRIFSKNDMTRWLAEILGASENKKKFTTKDDVECVLCVYHLLDYKGDVKQLQLVEGDISTPYEPYTEQTVQIALDEPLRGIGEYKDTITKDGAVRKIKRTVFDGSEDEKWALSNDPKNVTTNRFMIGMDTINTYYKIFTMCDKLSWEKANNVDLVGQTTHGKAFYVTMSKELAPNLEAFKTWLSQNPLTVDYVLAEPVTEPLPESVQAQLQAMHSENGTTHVIIDSGEVAAEISATYMRK